MKFKLSKEKIMKYIEAVKSASKKEKEMMYFEAANVILSLANSRKCKNKGQKKLSILFLVISVVEVGLITKDIYSVIKKKDNVGDFQEEVKADIDFGEELNFFNDFSN